MDPCLLLVWVFLHSRLLQIRKWSHSSVLVTGRASFITVMTALAHNTQDF